MTVLRLEIDSRPARQGAQAFARSAEDIRRAAGAAELSIRNVEGAFNRLRQSFRRGEPAMCGVTLTDSAFDVTGTRRLSLGAAMPQGGLRALASTSKDKLSEALEELLERNPSRLQEDFDSAVDGIDSLGGILDLLGDVFQAIAKKVSIAEMAAKVLRVFLDPFLKQTKTADAYFQSFSDHNAALPGLRELSADSTGEAKRVFVQLRTRFEQATFRQVAELIDIFARQHAAVADELSKGPLSDKAFRETVDILEGIARIAVDPRVAKRIRATFEAIRDIEEQGVLPSVDLPEIPERRRLDLEEQAGPSRQAVPAVLEPTAYGRTGGSAAERTLEVEVLRSGVDAATEATLRLDQSLGQALNGSLAFAEGARAAFADYAGAATNTGAQIEHVVGRALGRLEDALVGFVQTGKLEWRSLIDAMIADLIRLFIRAQILGPLAQGLGGGFGGSSGLSGSYPGVTFTAQGAAFDGGRRIAYARGGVVGQPTLFPMARGIGLMGEAGPEAILPLKRLPGGDLGVRAAGGRAVFNQTIVNEAGVEVRTEERENAAGGVDQLLVLVRRDAEQQMMGGQLGRLTAQRFGLSDRPFGR